MDRVEVVDQLARLTLHPVVLEAEHDNVRSKFADARRADHRLHALVEGGLVHQVVEGFDVILLQPLRAVQGESVGGTERQWTLGMGEKTTSKLENNHHNNNQNTLLPLPPGR